MSTKKSDRDFLTGQMLIAMPNMGDHRFERSVVLICSHNDEHAMGVIINKTIETASISDLLKQLNIVTEDEVDEIDDGPVHYGGPVQQDRGLVIHSLDYRAPQTLVITDEIGVTGTRDILTHIAARDARKTSGPEQYFLALGHAGWSSGQLEEEIAMNAWAHVESDETLVFAGAGEDAWRNALARLGVTAAMLSPEWSNIRDIDEPLH